MAKKIVANKKYTTIGIKDAVVFCGSKVSLSGRIAHDLCESDLDQIRKARIEVHLKKGDYFSTLAAVLHIVTIDKKLDKNKVLKNLVCDLLYLQAKYKITKRIG